MIARQTLARRSRSGEQSIGSRHPLVGTVDEELKPWLLERDQDDCCGNEEKKKRVARTRTWHNWNLSVLNWIFCAHCSREIGVVYSFMICTVSSKGNKTLFSLWNLVSHHKYVCLYDVNIWRCVLLEYYNSKWILISLLAYLVEYNRTKSGGKWTMNNGVAP